MSSTTLNLVAIGIFLMTAASLLGPALHLSPAIPAAATAGLLGLASVDRVLWNGQGGTLLVDWVANRSPDRRDRVLYHEAGHFLVAHLLDIPVSGYALNAWEAFRQGQQAEGGVRFDDLELAAQLDRGELSARLLRNYSTVWMAGIAAETLVYGEPEGGAEDRTKLRALLNQLQASNPRGVPDYPLQKSLSIVRAKTLIEQHRAAYDCLIDCMRQGESVAACRAAIAAALESEAVEQRAA